MPVKSHPPNPHRGLERFPLLTDTDPGTDRCINVWIPDSPEYLELFGTAMRWLMNGFKYERDLTHKGEAQARAFTRAYAAHLLSDCGGSGVSITFRQTNCLLEYSTDDGATWETAYVGADCLDWGVSTGRILGGSAIDDAIAAGKIAAGQQQGPSAAPNPGQCQEFYVTLSANQKWICPFPVDDYYQIVVDQCKGGWTPDPTHYWYCPSGETYQLGGCTPGTGATDSSDPLNTVNHMKLVGNAGSHWFDAYNTTHQIPYGTGLHDLYLQANDSDITNNLGSVTFHIQVCNVVFTHTWDFVASDGGWSQYISPWGVYSAGVGWVTSHSGGGVAIYIKSPLPGRDFTLLSLDFETDQINPDGGGGNMGFLRATGGSYTIIDLQDPSTAWNNPEVQHWAGGEAFTSGQNIVVFGSSDFGGQTKDVVIKRVTVTGIGNDPF